MYFAILLFVFLIFFIFGLISNEYNNHANGHLKIEFEDNRKDINEAQQHMKLLALAQKNISYSKSWKKLDIDINRSFTNIKNNHKFLLNTQERFINLVPASRWLIDNYYLIEKEIKIFKQCIKKNNYRKLPVLNTGDYKGIPRIFAISKEMLKSSGYHLDEEWIKILLNAYQEETTLEINELYMLLNVLKACIIQYIELISFNLVHNLNAKINADKIMDDVLDQNSINEKLFRTLSSNRFIDEKSFLTQLLYKIRQNSLDETELVGYLNNRYEDIDVNTLIALESQEQSKTQIIISSLVTSLREEASIDYEKLFKSISTVEDIFNHDPIDFYKKMDFKTKIDYHNKVQYLALKTNQSEQFIAKSILKICSHNYENNGKYKKSHVGYYLTKSGQKTLLDAINYKPGVIETINNWVINNAAFWYFGAIIIISFAVITFCIYYSFGATTINKILVSVLVGILTIIPAFTIAVEIANFLFTKIVKPSALPTIDFLEGIPEDYKTLVVMPVVLVSQELVEKYLKRLETYYLANNDPNLYFALLGDFKDSKEEHLVDDKPILDYTINGINELNAKYSKVYKFNLFHREREYNSKQECYMGRERKRGILDDLNSIISGKPNTGFSTIVGDTNILTTFKFVITIDAGTELIRDSAKKLIGMMAHPLNMPIINQKKNIVEDGYTIIQPRIGIRVQSALSTRFSKIFSGQAGIDTYPLSVADIYQDVFGKGTFGGKGIYDPRIFHKVISEEIPENTILSHDLIESCYVQCALASNVELMDDFPSNIISFFMREHRWVRGDWQLLPWLISKSNLSGLSKYKIIDNLRRSLIPLSYIILFIFAITLLNWSFYVWGTIILFSTLFPLVIHVSKTTVAGFEKYGSYFNILSLLKNILIILFQGIVWFAILPYRAYINTDAIIRTVYRVFVSKKKLLEWKTADAVEQSIKNNFILYMGKMWFNILLGLVIVLLPGIKLEIYARITGILWIIAPVICYIISLPVKSKEMPLTTNEIYELKLISRKTWRYFEEFFKKEYNYLVPDNFQVFPENGIAARTSTTNIGLELICILGAYDFGYISINNLIDRIEKVFETLNKLEKWNGHYYNWYDINNLSPLIPKYVSTVDSGNFIGSLITLKSGLNDIKDKPIMVENIISALKLTSLLAENEYNYPDKVQHDIKSYQKFINYIKDNNSGKNKSWYKLLDNMCIDFINSINDFEVEGTDKVLSLNELAKLNNNHAKEIIKRIDGINTLINIIINDIDFKALYDYKRNVFKIGYNVTLGVPDNSYYDLLASEARLASLIAIAKDDIPLKHWFALGRALTLVKGIPTLVSWSGTMFEYLMPNLLTKLIPRTLLYSTVKGAVYKQIQYGNMKNVPWGMSEAAYYRFDQHLNYQYRAIGVPGLGFSSDIGKFLVIAPYASMLALPLAPKECMKNIYTLKQYGCYGDYGFYEAIDFLASKEKFKKYNVVKSYFAHHQGMSFIALANFLNNNAMQNRFHRDPAIKSIEVLLEEKYPEHIVIMDPSKDIKKSDAPKLNKKSYSPKVINVIKPKYPVANILSNNSYSIMLTSTGACISWCEDLSINRWRPDYVEDKYGMFCYIKDIDTNKFWSNTYQPSLVRPDNYEVKFYLDKSEYKRTDGKVDTRTEVVVSPLDNTEVRRITITNNSDKEIILEVTSYFEVVLDKYLNDVVHQAFSKLFIETEYINHKSILLATRRPRERERERKWLANCILVDGKIPQTIEYETDRAKFIGRNNNLENPDAVTKGIQLSNTIGKVLDAIMSFRIKIKISPGKSKTINLITSIQDSREEAINTISNYQKSHAIEDCFKMASYNSEIELQYLDITPIQASTFMDMIGSIFYRIGVLRGPIDAVKNNKLNQCNLWRFGISGDYPIILFRINSNYQLDNLKEFVLAYEYLQLKGVKVDLVVLNENNDGYLQELNNKISDVLSTTKSYDATKKGMGVYLIQSDSISKEENDLLFAVADIVIQGDKKAIAKSYKNLEEPIQNKYIFNKKAEYPEIPIVQEKLEYFNEIGGYTKDGKEYIIYFDKNKNTPAPWINVISNKYFGFIISASGGGYTWGINSSQNKLTYWSNDPVTDEPGEVIYIRDEETGRYFTPSILPYREQTLYKVRHGFGYTVFEHNSLGLEQKTIQYVSKDLGLKFYKIFLKNRTNEKRTISVTLYANIIMDVYKEKSMPFVVSSYDNELELLNFKNTYSTGYSNYNLFMFSTEKVSSFTTSREEFIGDGSLKSPNSMKVKELSNKAGQISDICGGLKVNIEINPNQEKEIYFIMGILDNESNMSNICRAYKNISNCQIELDDVIKYWEDQLNIVKVYTPDNDFNYLMNGWLLYQVISSRIMGKAGFYQSSGAFGFRDQLQDVLSVLMINPDLAKDIIINHSRRQFFEGDVQHWWHDDSGRGVRTRTSDDLLWLPYVTAIYIKATNDYDILNITTNYLEDKELKEDEYDRYCIPKVSDNKGTLYEHCIKAIERSLKYGAHGLPLIGTGDWNDGMNKVGNKGRGESVWLGWFLYDVLNKFLDICEYMNDNDNLVRFKNNAKSLISDIENHSWDGEWYKRAFFDNGDSLGSKYNSECKIDSIPQSWSVIAGGEHKRSTLAMDSVLKYLVNQEDQVISLLTPPFDKNDPNPGYIQGYLPGIRENGGQYTHAAAWVVIALLKLKEGDTGYRLFKMLNPINHTLTYTDLIKYKNEPYVLSGDIYSMPPNNGRGGWSWYTGAAGWIYQAGLNWMLGITKEGSKLLINPIIPKEWGSFRVEYIYGRTKYNLIVNNPTNKNFGVKETIFDGVLNPDNEINLIDDEIEHSIIINMNNV